jgi:hypothetical protein
MGETSRLAAIRIALRRFTMLPHRPRRPSLVHQAGIADDVDCHNMVGSAVSNRPLFDRGMIAVGQTEVPPLPPPDKVIRCA